MVSWQERYAELVEYKKREGDCDVPQKNHGKLGGWVSKQRQLKKKGKLSADQQQKLEKLGFNFQIFKRRHGSSNSGGAVPPTDAACDDAADGNNDGVDGSAIDLTPGDDDDDSPGQVGIFRRLRSHAQNCAPQNSEVSRRRGSLVLFDLIRCQP